ITKPLGRRLHEAWVTEKLAHFRSKLHVQLYEIAPQIMPYRQRIRMMRERDDPWLDLGRDGDWGARRHAVIHGGGPLVSRKGNLEGWHAQRGSIFGTEHTVPGNKKRKCGEQGEDDRSPGFREGRAASEMEWPCQHERHEDGKGEGPHTSPVRWTREIRADPPG